VYRRFVEETFCRGDVLSRRRFVCAPIFQWFVTHLGSVVDPKLFFSDPDPIFIRVLDPDSDPLRLVKSYGSSYGSDPKYSLVDNPNNKKAFSRYFKAFDDF
jgi:hypothetical protein